MKLFRLILLPGRQVRSLRGTKRLRASLAPVWKALPRPQLIRIQEVQRPFFTALHELLDRYPVITMGQLLEEAGEQAWGLTVLLLAMFTFIPGVANILSLATIVFGIRMMGGAAQPWLPGNLRRMELHRGRFKELLAKVEMRIRWLAKRRGPRKAPSQRFMGFLVAWTAFVASLPIPLPFANVLPAIALILYGVALLEEWPFMAWLGASLSLGTMVYFAFSIRQILIMFVEMWQWFVTAIQPGCF